MKKKIIFITVGLVAAVATTVSIHVSKKMKMTSLLSANIEALTEGEDGSQIIHCGSDCTWEACGIMWFHGVPFYTAYCD